MNMKQYGIIGGILLVLFGGVYIVSLFATKPDTHKRVSADIRGQEVTLMVSDTELLREQGLGGYTGLGSREGMLFIFEKMDRQGFWMKDMLFPMDIMWLDGEFRVISLEKNIAPETYPKIFFPKVPSLYAIEFSAGTLTQLGVEIGDLVRMHGGK